MESPFHVPPSTALILIDMQNAIDDPFWSKEGPRNHPSAEDAALRLIAAWRAAAMPVYHVRHDSIEPQSTYRPGQAGNADALPGLDQNLGQRQRHDQCAEKLGVAH